MSKMKSESEERPSPSHGDSLLPKTYQIGKKVLIFGPRGLLRATISKIGPTRVDVITEGGNRLVSIGKHEIENRTYIFDPPGVIRLLRKYKVESEVVGEISSAPEVDVANSADFGDESVAATGAPE
ncbi:hypothetical protein D918_03940 [Trichuris suis]|nr:hypothetical protein D918_03940 [Trichuris suis]